MAFARVNNYDVEYASSRILVENIMLGIEHINGKGCTDSYTPTDAVEDVMKIDVKQILPLTPYFRQIGSENNGAWHNKQNEGGYNNASQSKHYTIDVDLFYDTGIPIPTAQEYSSATKLEEYVKTQIVDTVDLIINIVTFAKQFIAFFKDSFTPGGATEEEIANAIVAGDRTLQANQDGSYAKSFIRANAKLNAGCMEIGAMTIPMSQRQAFITYEFDTELKGQYMMNASDTSAKILATGFINPWTNEPSKRVDLEKTQIAGTFDGVDMFFLNPNMMKYVEIVMGLGGMAKNAERALFEKIQAMICYGGATLRGIVGPTVEANPNTYYGGMYILPKLKMGVKVLSGKTIKVVTEGKLTTENINSIVSALKFTPIDGVAEKAENVFGEGIVNDGTSN